MLGIPSPPAHGGSWAVSKSTTVFFWYPFFQMVCHKVNGASTNKKLSNGCWEIRN